MCRPKYGKFSNALLNLIRADQTINYKSFQSTNKGILSDFETSTKKIVQFMGILLNAINQLKQNVNSIFRCNIDVLDIT